MRCVGKGVEINNFIFWSGNIKEIQEISIFLDDNGIKIIDVVHNEDNTYTLLIEQEMFDDESFILKPDNYLVTSNNRLFKIYSEVDFLVLYKRIYNEDER
jgi:hypothetical protein